MEDNAKLVESLLEKAADYGKASYDLVKLKALDKTSDAVSSFVPNVIVVILVVTFLLFLNLGLAYCLGDVLGSIFLGFFIVAAFYALAGLVVHFFMHDWLKRVVGDYFIKQILK
jgi:fatty acid desaturase